MGGEERKALGLRKKETAPGSPSMVTVQRALYRTQGGAEDSYSAWHFFCVRIIQQKVTSHPVRQRVTSLPGAKAKIYGNRFFYSVSKMMIFCNRLHILSLFFVHPVKELSLFTSMDYSTV